jgi:hypothetical protein
MDRVDQRILSNAGRCDICGSPIDMRDAGDQLVIQEFGVDEETTAEHGVTDADAIDAVADAMEAVAESGAGYDLAETIRESGAIRTHERCVSETNFSKLTTEAYDGD